MLRKLTNVILFITLIGLLLARLNLAFVRYFDVDEFAHMHWTYLTTIGKLPYRDFFFYVIPVYQWLMAPVFLLRPDATVLILARVAEFFVYTGSVLLIYRIAAKTTGFRLIGLLAGVLFTIFPMTFDKTIEVRPDMLMIFLYLLAADLIIYTHTWSNKRALIIGIIAATDILLLPKIIFAIPALALLFLVKKPRPNLAQNLWLIIGGVIPALIFFAFLAANNLTQTAIVAILHDSVAVNAGKIPFSPWKALSPFPLVYITEGEPSFPWQVNTLLWIGSGLGLLVLLGKRLLYGLFFLTFTIFGVIFLFAFPAPYTQYFMPLSAFAVIMTAYLIYQIQPVLRFIFKNQIVADFGLLTLLAVTVTVCVQSFLIQYQIRIKPGNTNDEQVGVVNSLLKISKDTDTVFDMVGSFVFRPDAYYFCCHPYTEFAANASVKTPPLMQMLVTNKTKFIILDRTGQSLWLTPQPDLDFIRAHYLPCTYNKIYTLGTKFSCEAGNCTQLDMDNRPVKTLPQNTLEIIVPEQYQISTIPQGRIIKLSGVPHPSGSTLLNQRYYHIIVDKDLLGFTVQLDR
jgi:hypothetical protein